MKPLYLCLTKGTTAEGDQMKYGPNWALARRGSLKIFEDHLECGDWVIKNEDIKEAILYSIRTSLLLPGYVLKIETSERTYHFGLNWGKFWKGDLPFEVKREKGRLGYSLISIIARIIIFGYLAYFIWKKFLN